MCVFMFYYFFMWNIELNNWQESLDAFEINQSLQELKDWIEWKDDKNPFKEMIEKQKWPLMHWNRDKPEISLTFDDGYWTENVKHVLDTLRWSWIKATFFILWDCLKNTPELWKQAAKEWHQICCHTFSHIYMSSEEYTDLWDKKSWISAWPWNLNKTDLNVWTNNVKLLLWDDYLKNLRIMSWNWFPRKVRTDLLLETEILMWETQIKKTLWSEYLKNFKQNHPFFRFPWGCWDSAPRNINVLKKLWYLAIWWSEDFFRWKWSNRKHMSLEWVRVMSISNWDIPLFHFKKSYGAKKATERDYIDAYIDNMKNRNKTSHEVSHIVK